MGRLDEYLWINGADNVGAKRLAGDQYLYSHEQIDMQGSYKVYYKPTFAGGLRYTLNRER